MPIIGEVDISKILANLGDPTHGLVPARPQSSIEDRDEIFRATYGTVDMSTSVALAVIPKFVWDVNGYYRALDISSPFKATKKELREGYHRVEGHTSERVTYYLKQLLQPDIRAEYDAMALGSHFRDRYAIEADMRKLSKLAKVVSEAEGRIVTVDDLVAEHDSERRRELPPLPPGLQAWTWGFYALQSRAYASDPLERWQAHLTRAFADRGVATTISIGYIGNTKEESDIRQHDGRTVFFLNEDTTPTRELAEAAVSKHMAH